ncbi:long-subunit fatty acid transport protein [Parabacteroides sp. PFB2-12]|uniref:hypothetical protein n=1 Tax=Parabacteroides sp. PFB2-12 TaxID=2940652 RepID=UPI002474F8DC|nr:hypothetical protein [Parabacteroides sp. PFB2-12]MDH6389096.1 long-subunit fatty acid transport protein [Parabacteroides sp. PFB2-12]
MLKISRVVVISILIVTQLQVWAQNNTNSPYTRFGYGEIADRSFGAGRAMGGLGIGLRSGKQVNPMNPASYTAVDSMTFIFDMGVHVQRSWYTDGENKQSNYNGNLEYIAMLFPIHKQIAMSAGILPYSFVGYEFGESVTEGTSYSNVFSGSGGLNEVYVGLSIDIWKKRLALGANVGYLFGKIDHQQTSSFPQGSSAWNSVNMQRVKVNDVKFDFGLQYTHPLSATQKVVVGAVYSPAKQLNSTSYNILQVGSTSSGGYIESDTTSNQRFDLPNSVGLGVSYTKNNKLTVGADVKYEDWSTTYFFDKNDSFDNRLRIALGAEYIPNFQERNILKRSRYRAGAHYSNSYRQATIQNTRYGFKEYGVSVGMGIPVRTGYPYDENRSLINISLEYVKVQPELRTMVKEQYLRLTLNLTFNEMWFLKRKI